MSYSAETVKNANFNREGYIAEASFYERPMYDFVKRVFDIFASIMALIILAIPIGIITIIIRVDSPGNVIYCQERLTKDGKKFLLYKFRTMRTDAEKDGAKWADKEDSRVTRVGRFLRNSRLDEVLQFVNVLKGDLSIVGPRPEREIFHTQFCEEIDNWDKRLLVKQGITGLSQVSGGYDLSPSEKIVYDLEYIEKRSFWLDIKILFKTAAIVLNGRGAR